MDASSSSSSVLNMRMSVRPHHHHQLSFSFSFSFFKPKPLSLTLTTTTTASRSVITSLSLRTQTQLPDTPKLSETHASTTVSTLPKTDKSGRFCSPRAARELALSIVYAACLEGSDPVRLFEKRINARREPGYEFNKATLLQYNHMSFGGPPVTVHSVEEENELTRLDNNQSDIEAEVLAAPPKLVYSKLILRLTKKILVAVTDQWDSHVLVIDKVAPPNWKDEPAGRILEFCILRLAMSEIEVLGTRHQIVINEAVDLAKRFCDGAAPRIINGCLRTFVNNIEETGLTLPLELDDKHKVVG